MACRFAARVARPMLGARRFRVRPEISLGSGLEPADDRLVADAIINRHRIEDRD